MEMGKWGATLEFIEVAYEFQGFGIGTELYSMMEFSMAINCRYFISQEK